MDQQNFAHSNWHQKKDAHMFFSVIHFFEPFSIFHIPHNYVIPQAVPHAIQQTHSSFYPHRSMFSNLWLHSEAFYW